MLGVVGGGGESTVIGGLVPGGTAGRILFVGTGPVLSDSAKFTVSETAGIGMTIAAGASTVNTQRALIVSQSWASGSDTNIGLIGNFTMVGGSTGKLLSLQAGAAGTTEVLYVDQGGLLTATGVNVTGTTVPANGIYLGASNQLFIGLNSTSFARFVSSTLQVIGTAAIGWAPAGDLAFGNDTAISRVSAGVLGVGTGAAASVAGTIRLTAVQDSGSNQVVGTRGAAVADASGGAVQDAEARTALNALLARLRTHGLIAT